MKKLMRATLTGCALICSATALNAQLTNEETKPKPGKTSVVNGYAAEFYAGGRIERATPANVIKWAAELNTELGKLSSKLAKIKTTNAKEARAKKLIEDARARCVQIMQKGQSLTAAEAKQHDKWFWNGMFSLVGDCLETNPGSECCFSCNGGGAGYSDFWCKANCFVWRFPSLD